MKIFPQIALISQNGLWKLYLRNPRNLRIL